MKGGIFFLPSLPVDYDDLLEPILSACIRFDRVLASSLFPPLSRYKDPAKHV